MKVYDAQDYSKEGKVISEDTNRIIVETKSGRFTFWESSTKGSFQVYCDGIIIIKSNAANQIILEQENFEKK